MPKVSARIALLNLANALAEDVLSMTDEELLAEIKEDGEDIEKIVARFDEVLAKAKRRYQITNDLKTLASRPPSRHGPFVFDEDKLQKLAPTPKEPDQS